jgi:hypothetical protein
MASLKDLYTGTFIIMFLLVIYVFVHYYKKEEDEIEDLDHDGKIGTSEIIHHIKKELDKSSQQPKFWMIVKSCLTGLLRGFLMGMLLNGVEAAVVTSISLGIINPIMLSIDHWF